MNYKVILKCFLFSCAANFAAQQSAAQQNAAQQNKKVFPIFMKMINSDASYDVQFILIYYLCSDHHG
jgi:hypothetical protein